MTFAEIIPAILEGKTVKHLSSGYGSIKLKHGELKYKASTGIWYQCALSQYDLESTDWEVIE